MKARRVVAFVDSTRFWVVVALAAVVVVFVYSFSAAQAEVARNADVLRRQQQALSYLCETVRVLELISVQSVALDRAFFRDQNLAPSVRATINRRLNLWRQAHREFSDTRACRQIE